MHDASEPLKSNQKDLVVKLFSHHQKLKSVNANSFGTLLCAWQVFSNLGISEAADRLNELKAMQVSKDDPIAEDKFVTQLSEALTKSFRSTGYSIQTYFNGVFERVFPVDCAILQDGKPVAFVSVHTSSAPTRFDLMKESVYKKQYPESVYVHCRRGDVEASILRLKEGLNL